VRFVLANRLLHGAGGTETHLLTIGDHLQRLGHDVVLYSPELGPFADHVRGRGLEVVDQVRLLPSDCDVVFAQDAIVVYDMAERYPDARLVFRVCGDRYDFQSPPQTPGLVDLVVALSDRYLRLTSACAVRTPVLRLRVPIDVDRLVPLDPIAARPRRAILLGNYGDRLQVLCEVWGAQGIVVDQVGGAQPRFDVASALQGADVVVAKGRAALDAMACGRAVYVFDTRGGDGWVTADSYPALEADNFTGTATGRVVTPGDLEHDLAAYDPAMGAVNRDLAMQHHRARDHVVELLAALEDVRPSERPHAPLRELSRLTAMQWSWERLAHEGFRTQAGLYQRMDAAQGAVGRAEQLQDELRLRITHVERELSAAQTALEQGKVALEEGKVAFEEEKGAFEAQLRQATAALVATRQDLADAESARDSLSRRVEELQVELGVVYESRSWRVTRPLRRLRHPHRI
jgi:hypothetical protein